MDRDELLRRLDALNGCGVQITALVGRWYQAVDISEVADESQRTIRDLIDQLADAVEQIERLEAEAEKREAEQP